MSSNGFVPKIVAVALKTFVAFVAAVVPPKIFVVTGVVVLLKKSVVGTVVPPKMFVVAGAVVPPNKFVVVAVIPPKMFVVVIESLNGKTLLLPSVILEKGVEFTPNTELED